MLFCAFVATAWAGPTDLPEMSTEGNIKWYTIKNVRKQKFATYAGDAATMTQQATASAASFFYFTGSITDGVATVKIHNYAAGEKLCAAYNSWTANGIDWYLKAQSTGVSICTSTDEWNAWNDAGGGGQLVEYWSASDAGSAWEFTLVTDFSAVIDVPAAKAAAIAEVNNYAVVSSIYPVATSTVEAINAVTPADNSIAGLNAAIEAINAKVVDYKKAAYAALEGKYFSIQTLTTERSKGFMEMAGSNVVGVATLASPAGLWQFVSNNDGTLKVFNPYTGKYLCEPQGASTEVAVTTDANSAGNYTLEVNASAAVADAKIKLTSNGKSVHMAGGHTLVRWDNGGASEWQVKEVTEFSTLITTYKNNTIATLDQWATLSVVFDASLIATAKANIKNINTTDFDTFAALDTELTNVTDAVAAKMFTFQTLATDNKRNGVWVSANASTGKAIGAETQDYNAIWSLRHAGGVSFYIYNELTAKYMGKPSGNATLTDAPVDAYTFEIIDAANGIVEFKCGSETLHASNHDDDKLMNYDGDKAASRWYIRTIDLAADIQAILDGLTPEDYAETPALGQYPTAAYEALVAARTTAKTEEEVEAAIAAFKKAKNVPVYFITSKHDGYAAGSAIYYDGAWQWKTANKYDKQMWMTIPDYNQANVPAVDAYNAEGTSYAICDYLTGTKMRGKDVQIVKVADWEGAYNLQYNADATSTDAAQHAKDTGDLVNWKPGTKNDAQASVWGVEYIGSSYELAQLTDAHIEAVSALYTSATANAKYVDVEIGSGLGQYTGNKEAFNTAIADAQAIQSKTVLEVAAMNVADITAITTALTESTATFKLNMPTAGFYRVKSMNANDANKKGKYWQSKEDASGMELAAEKDDARSIIYLGEDNSVTSYGCGYALNQYAGMDAAGTEGKAWTITENAAVAGAYALHRNGDAYCLSDWYGLTYGQNDANAAWAIEEVTVLPVKVSAAGYATLYAPVALTLPAELKAYTVTVNGESAMLNEIEGGVIPANTGVVLEGTEGDYTLTIGGEATAVVGNDLLGTVAASYITADAYALGLVDGEVGFYTATKNQQEGASWLNNGFKAYLPKTGLAATLRFNFGGNTTAIESVLIGTDANAPIYDLSGRRVNNAVKGGIYIVNGKKVYIK